MRGVCCTQLEDRHRVPPQQGKGGRRCEVSRDKKATIREWGTVTLVAKAHVCAVVLSHTTWLQHMLHRHSGCQHAGQPEEALHHCWANSMDA